MPMRARTAHERGLETVDAIIVTNGTAEEIAALAVGLQERNESDGSKRTKCDEIRMAESIVMEMADFLRHPQNVSAQSFAEWTRQRTQKFYLHSGQN